MTGVVDFLDRVDGHPAERVEFRDTDHAYRVWSRCESCTGTGEVAGKREGTTKKCPGCKGERVRWTRVPSVTTVLAELNKPALVGWAARMGADAVRAQLVEWIDGWGAGTYPLAHSDLEHLHALAANAHRTAKDDAADTGTRVHDWIERYLHDPTTPPPTDDARPACTAFVAWWATAGLEVVQTERIVVDPSLRYAGRFDLIARDRRGRLFVLDFKTSNSIYLEHVLQCAAYATALRRETEEAVAGTIVVWVHKDGRPVRTVTRTPREYRADYRVFAALLGVYEHRKLLGRELRKLAAESAAEVDLTVPFQ